MADQDVSKKGGDTPPAESQQHVSNEPSARAETKVPDEGKGKKTGEDVAMNNDVAEALLDRNPTLRNLLGHTDKVNATDTLKKMDIADLLTGLSMNTRNQKDMASYKFWQTQPVIRFDDTDRGKVEDGPIKKIDPAKVSKEPDPLIEGFEWATLNIDDDKELRELYELLAGHYVEDVNAMFRFNYSTEFLNWALKCPGWRKNWHVGVRASKSQKLVASICGIPAEVYINGKRLKVTEINFLCIHKKLRSKRLAPVLIKEITRRAYLDGVFQAVYTVGSIIPTPISACRYYHRSLNWPKLYEVGFSPLPQNSTKERQVIKYRLPKETTTPGLRPMEKKDVGPVHKLLNRYLERFRLRQVFSKAEIEHLLLQEPGKEQVVWSYVVEDHKTHKITDFASFYSLESTVIQNDKHTDIKAAYLYYYATESAFNENEEGLKETLQRLVNDMLILAKQAGFDVVNAITLQDNPLFLEKLRFGAGDGTLYYYLYNYRTAHMPGGINDFSLPDERERGGIGMILV